MCDLCDKLVLHPFDEELRKKHVTVCLRRIFAYESGREKTCDICYETISDERRKNRAFGILPNCYHCFCITCISTWFDKVTVEEVPCPHCRVPSNRYYYSKCWVSDKEEKDNLIAEHAQTLAFFYLTNKRAVDYMKIVQQSEEAQKQSRKSRRKCKALKMDFNGTLRILTYVNAIFPLIYECVKILE